MSDFGSYNSGPNPFLWAAGAMASYKPDIARNPEAHRAMKKQYKVAMKNYKSAMKLHAAHQPQTSNTMHEPTEGNAAQEETQMEKPMATHPITGAQVPKVPTKRSNNNPTPAGTKPKKK